MTAKCLIIAAASLVLSFGTISAQAQPLATTTDPTDWQGQLARAEELRWNSPRSEANERAVNYWYRKAAASGASQALIQAGCYFYDRGAKENQEEARGMIRQAAELGDPDAKLALAKFVALGIGGPQNEQDALQLIREASEIYRDPVTIAAYAHANATVKAAAKADSKLGYIRWLGRLFVASCGPSILPWAKKNGIYIDETPGVDIDKLIKLKP